MAGNDTMPPQTTTADTGSAKAKGAAETLKDSAGKLSDQASGKARDYATQGKARAAGALDEFSKLMNDAAGSVDDKLGAQYGDYARSAARSLSGFSQSLDAKDVDELLNNARDFVRKSPAVAIGTAAAIGFVLARLVKSGLDAADAESDRT
jgi:ElaB/YqjD/DUF883 family membrane-anchored ribosome-binding protein